MFSLRLIYVPVALAGALLSGVYYLIKIKQECGPAALVPCVQTLLVPRGGAKQVDPPLPRCEMAAASSGTCFDAPSSEPQCVIPLCTALLDGHPDKRSHERALNRRALAYSRLGRHKDALADFNALIARNNTEAGYYGNRVSAHKALGNLNLAFADANEAVSLADDLDIAPHSKAWFYHIRGEVLFGMGSYDRAVSDFTTALSLSEKQPSTYGLSAYERGRTFLKAGKLDLAVKDFSMTLEKSPGLTSALKERGLAYLALAERDFAAFLQKDPSKLQVVRAEASRALERIGAKQ
jgi:tetratricopeptide (TPR) repeat protein